MSVKFRELNHEYASIDPNDKMQWRSVTSVISEFKHPFDAVKISERVSKKKNSKWYGIPPAEIRAIWASENKRATDLGSWYHEQREADICEISTMERDGVPLQIFQSEYSDGWKIAPTQRLVEGIYPELLVHLSSAGICGQADRVEVVGNKVHVYDYKTNKEIKTKSFYHPEGGYKMMLPPVSHMQDCNYNHYALQLSIYMYIILRHNPHFEPGKIEMHHIKFETDGETTEYGNPIYKQDAQGNFIVSEIIPYSLPYLKKEVKDILDHVKKFK